jgi:hypothetical protein
MTVEGPARGTSPLEPAWLTGRSRRCLSGRFELPGARGQKLSTISGMLSRSKKAPREQFVSDHESPEGPTAE